jgi:hypothetical protein
MAAEDLRCLRADGFAWRWYDGCDDLQCADRASGGDLWRAGGIRVSCVRHIGLMIPRVRQMVVARPSMSKAKHSR